MIKALEAKTSIAFNFAFANRTTLLCFSPFYLKIDVNFKIPPLNEQIFNSAIELVIPTGISTEAKAEKQKLVK